MVELRRRGLTFDEIAAHTGLSERGTSHHRGDPSADGGSAMAMMPHPRDRARSGWGTALGFPSSEPLPPVTPSLSWPIELPESGALGSDPPIDTILAEFTSRWQRGEDPSIAEFLTLLGPARASDAAALVYHAFCLAESAGLNPDLASYIKRFPEQGRSLERLLCLHRAFDTSQLQLWADPATLPEVGDEIGPYVLLRAGRGRICPGLPGRTG